METKQLIYQNNMHDTIEEAAALLKAGEVVAFPTETVYGLGADATNEDAVQKIYRAKGRPGDNPLIVHVADKEQLETLVTDYPNYVDQLIEAFSPGPITYVLKSNHRVTSTVTGGLGTVGIRIPKHPVTQELLKACQLPVAGPSANLSGKPSPTTAQHVMDDLQGRIPAILDGGLANVGVESTVIDCTKEIPVILRFGQITQFDLEKIVGTVHISDVKNSDTPKSPGVKYKHYVPEVPLVLMDEDDVIPFVQKEKALGKKVGVLTTKKDDINIGIDKQFIIGESIQEMAANLYHILRAMKQTDVDIVIAYGFTKEKAGSAVMDRLCRAATTNYSLKE